MHNFEKQKGIAFFLLYFSHKEVFYYLRLRELLVFWERAKNGGRKSFRMDELEQDYFFKSKQGVFVPYLELMQKDMLERDE